MSENVEFKYGSARATLSYIVPRVAQLKNVWSEIRGRGDGRGVMQMVVNHADTHGATIVLKVQQFGVTDMGNAQLEEFYAKFGFEKIIEYKNPSMMNRLPSQEKQGL